jgi:hypothetical protein
VPKPLIELHGRPFFWWSAQSVLRLTPVRETVFVVLQEHVDRFAIDRRIRQYYPTATVVPIAEVTSGAAETAALGIAALAAPGPVAINDCDHAFIAPPIDKLIERLNQGLAGAVMTFQSSNPGFSYVRLDPHGQVTGTVEKQVVSDQAIAGCYLFADSAQFGNLLRDYTSVCPYPELFVSGMYNLLAERAARIERVELARHVPFGTPEEFGRVTATAFADFLAWA